MKRRRTYLINKFASTFWIDENVTRYPYLAGLLGLIIVFTFKKRFYATIRKDQKEG